MGKPDHICINLHKQFVFLGQSAASHQFMDRYTIILKGLDDDARSIRSRFNKAR